AADVLDEREEAADDLVEDLALFLKVEVKRALGDGGGARDVVDGRGVIAFLREHAARGLDELSAPLELPGHACRFYAHARILRRHLRAARRTRARHPPPPAPH